MTRRVLVGLLFLAAPALLPFDAQAATNLPCTNPHLATAEEAAAAPGGVIAGVTYICPKDTQLGVSADSGAAKTYLKSMRRGCVGQCAARPDDAHIDKLNNTLAICAAQFFKAYRAKYGEITITSAYRDGPSGENARAGGAPNSYHQYGLAIDVYPASGDWKTLWSFASSNPQYGVCFPYLGSDRPHLALAGVNTTEAVRCASQGVTKVCGTAAEVRVPNMSTSAGVSTSYDEHGAGGTSDPFQTGLQSLQMLQQLTAISSLLQQQSQAAQTQQPIYPQITPTPVILPPVTTPNASPIGSPITTPGNPITIPNTTGSATGAGSAGPSSTPSDSSANDTPTSALDLILQVAGIDSHAPIQNPSSVVQNGNIQDVSQVPTSVSAPNAHTTYQSQPQTQVFVSNDLSANAPHLPQTLSPADQVRFNSILGGLSFGLSQLASMIAAPARPFVQLSQWKPATPIFD